jgi:nuclear cap-binding protein subunit 1
LRLSYRQRVTEIVPDTFACFIPEKPAPQFRFALEGPGHSASTAMIASIKAKCSPEELLEQMREVEGDAMRVEVFTQSLLFLGHKSFSHSFAAIAKFHPVFKALADTEENQILVLRSVFELWKSHQQMLVVLCDKLLKTGIVECAAVANWVFSKDMVPEFSKCYIWEIVHITIKKMNKHVAKLSKEATEARRMIEDSESESSDSDEEGGGGKRGRRPRPLERPTEESVEKLEERLEAAQADQKNLFLIIFQRFIMILSEHLVRCDTDAVDFKNPWYMWTVGRLHQIFMLHHEQVERYSSTLETLLFTQDLDPNILDVFHQFVALRM